MKIRYVGDGIESVAGENDRDLRFVLSPEDLKNFGSVFDFLNEKDRDILYLVFMSGKSQSTVQKILNRSQPSLCYDIRRIKERLRFICYLHSVFDIFVDFLETAAPSYDADLIEVLVLMFYTTSYTHAARVTGQEYLKIRYRFDKAIRELERRRQWEVYEVFAAIRENLNIVRRFYRVPKRTASQVGSYV
jgi:hypothetical protein